MKRLLLQNTCTLFACVVQFICNVFLLLGKDDSRIIPPVWKDDMGKILQIRCRSFGNTKWYFGSPTGTPLYEHNNLITYHAKVYFTGTYYCYGMYLLNNEHFLAKAEVVVYGKHQIIFIKGNLHSTAHIMISIKYSCFNMWFNMYKNQTCLVLSLLLISVFNFLVMFCINSSLLQS